MSTTPNQMASSPPSSVTGNDNVPNKVIVPLPVIQQHDEIYYYVFVKGKEKTGVFLFSYLYFSIFLGSLYSSDSAVFGLEPQEIQAIAKKFNSSCKEIENGIMFKQPVCVVINALAQLGYRVISTCGEGETMFTLQREL